MRRRPHRPVWLSWTATHSRAHGEYSGQLRHILFVIEPVEKNPKGYLFYLDRRSLRRLSIRHYAGKIDNFSEPASIFFLLDLNLEPLINNAARGSRLGPA